MQRIITGAVAKVVVVAVLIGSLVQAADANRAARKPLIAILQAVTDAGYVDVTEVSFDKGEWEIEVLKNGKPLGLRVDPQTAKVRFEYADEPHPAVPPVAKPLADIVQAIEAAGYSDIRKADFEQNHWEIEATSSQGRRELSVDLNGKVLSDRQDD